MKNIDIVIVGAGFAGLSLAHAIADMNLKVVLVDQRNSCPDIFRAEKIEHNQAQLMRELGILDFRSPRSDPIGKTVNFNGSKLSEFDTVEQYGISYGETVNTLRSHMPPGIQILNERVREICAQNQGGVVLNSGKKIRAKLVVVATGWSVDVLESLGMRHKKYADLISLSFGFDIKREDDSPFDFRGFNYFHSDKPSRIQYLTIFPIGTRMRVNLFTQLEPADEMAKLLRNDTIATIATMFPSLEEHVGKIVLDSRVQAVPTEFYRVTNHHVPGVIVIGDAFQSVSPATGSGLSKVLMDVRTLSRVYIPKWLNQETISVSDVKAYYNHQEKMASDRRSLKSWYYAEYGSNTSQSILSRIRRLLLFSLRFGTR